MVTTIGEICNKVFSGGTPTSTNAAYYEGGTVPWLRTKEVNYCKIYDTEQRITQLGFENSSTKLVPANSVIVAMYGNGDTAGRVAINKVPITTNQACCNLVVDASKADYRFVYYYLMGQYRALVDLKNGGAQQNLNGQLIKAFPIALPSVEEQRELSGLLEALDDRITLLRETNATLEAIAQALFKSWFVDFDPVRAKMEGRAPEGMDEATAALFPDTLEESELGWVPKGWQVGRLDDLLVLQRGFDLPAQDRIPGAVPIIAASGPSGTHHEAMVQGPGVVTGRSGVLGRVFLEFGPYWPLNTTLWIKEFRAATPCFAYELLRLLDFKSFNAGSAVPTLNRNHIHGLAYLVPNRTCVEAFEGVASMLHQRVKANERQAQTLSTLRDTLLPRLISGQLRLPEAQAATEAALGGAL